MLVAPYACHWRNITLQRRRKARTSRYAAHAYNTFDFCHEDVASEMQYGESEVSTLYSISTTAYFCGYVCNSLR